jgi:hypothetical protein
MMKVALLALALVAAPALAQDSGLVRLRGSLVPTYYSPGSLDRASRLQGRLESIAREVGRQGKKDPSLTLYVLGREGWERQGLAVPYGIAVAQSSSTVAFPADADERSIELWRRLLGGALPLAPQGAAHSNPRETATLDVADLLVETELLRSMLGGIGLMSGEPWLDVVLAQAAARSVQLRVDPARASRHAELYRSLAPQLASVVLTSADLATGTWTPEQRLRLEAALSPAAGAIVDAEGHGVVKALARMKRKGDGVIDASAVATRWPALEGLQESLSRALTTP